MPVKTHDQLRDELNAALKVVKVNGVYGHFKDLNNKFRVIDLAFYENDEGLCVIYQSISEPELKFARPLSSWLERKEVDGKLVDRFQLLDN